MYIRWSEFVASLFLPSSFNLLFLLFILVILIPVPSTITTALCYSRLLPTLHWSRTLSSSPIIWVSSTLSPCSARWLELTCRSSSFSTSSVTCISGTFYLPSPIPLSSLSLYSVPYPMSLSLLSHGALLMSTVLNHQHIATLLPHSVLHQLPGVGAFIHFLTPLLHPLQAWYRSSPPLSSSV